MVATRIYEVREFNEAGEPIKTRLVEAQSQARSIQHVSNGRFWAGSIGAMRVAQLMGQGVTVEKASAQSAMPNE